jgi:hypothetical protein
MSIGCIYCGREGQLSGEHYLPRCLGNFRGYEQLKDRICNRCNNDFSVLDEQFCRSGPEAIIRERFNVRGYKHHKRKSPFQRGSAGARPLEFKGTVNGKGTEVDLYYHEPTGRARKRRQITFFKTNVGQVIIQVTDDMTEPDDLRAAMERAGIETASGSVKVVCEPEEWDWMLRLFSKYKNAMIGEPVVGRTAEGWFTGVYADARPTERYFRGLAKIGFHYFLKHMREFRGSEDCFADIRHFITEGRAEDVNRFIDGWVNEIIVDDLQSKPSADGYHHRLEAEADCQHLLSRLQFFIGPGLRLPAYTIYLGRSPLLIDYKRERAHSFIYSEGHRRDGYDGEMREAQSH